MFLFYKLKRNNFIIVLGFEQSNDFLTSDLFKATNRHEGEIGVDENEEDDSASTDNYIVQLLLRFLRLEHIEEEEEDEEEEDEEL